MRRAILSVAVCALVGMVALTAEAVGATGGVHNGVRAGTQPRSVSPHIIAPVTINFDQLVVPASFNETVSLHMLQGVSFSGGGTVLNDSSNFSVTGYSPLNFLAFNCASQTADPRVPKLPETINFGSNSRHVRLNVGSAGSAGKILKLHATNTRGRKQTLLVGLTSAVQNVHFGIKVHTLTLSSAQRRSHRVCQLVVDDITFIP